MLPKLKAGQRHQMALPPTSADTHLLAQLLQHKADLVPGDKAATAALVCAHAQDPKRIQEELAFFAPQLRCAVLPDWETLVYDPFSPHKDLISERLATLWQLQQGTLDLLIVSAGVALQRLPPPSFLAAYTFSFRKGQALDTDALKAQLTLAGYHHVDTVLGPGEYTVRGSLIDLFPMGSLLPYRLDLFDLELDSIRTFDVDSQRSLYPVDEIRLLPGHEFPFDEAARTDFKRRWREDVEGDPSKSRIYKDIGAGIPSPGIEYYLPLFFDGMASLFDYLPQGAQLFLHGYLEQAFQPFLADAAARYSLAQGDPERPVLPPERLFLSSEAFFLGAQAHPQILLRPAANAASSTAPASPVYSDTLSAATAAKAAIPPYPALPELAWQRDAEDPFARLKAYLPDHPTLLVAHSEGRRESLRDMLHASRIATKDFPNLAAFVEEHGKQGHPNATKHKEQSLILGIVVGQLYQGLLLPDSDYTILTESELFALSPQGRRHKKQERASDIQNLIQDLSALQIGDPVVHVQHGVGRYQGLIHMEVGTEKQEFLHLEYANQALLYVPVGQLHLISRYSGVSPDQAPLHKLGSGQWEKAKRKAAEQVRDSAAELLNIYASRAARTGHPFRFEASEYERFVQDFGFSETPDQLAAIHAVIQDMVSPRPMDRLVCGDVGFGKTEVALRAAFIAVLGGKQVAFLAPTTLLAEQHFHTLQDRFAKWPIKVVEMSRFRSPSEIKTAAAAIAEGQADIVVGTHKLLSSSVQFKNLGLLIIDEEHRFGVRHKEAMKALRAEIDVLTLTATPIPRTLGMALEGLRDLSIIATAPERRLAIKTFVRTENHGVIREAVQRELMRGGQIYFLHNDVASIEQRREQLTALLPEARIAIAHGQMPERELEHIMRDFVAQRYHILLCSTIIETGIDVPSANTILISRADKFGLAQLHQLRGRVGRSHHQAYAYLMVPDAEHLSSAAGRRLQAIQEMEELGSGFYLAMHDLEIRGAGEILGEHQSGNMLEIGFQLYNDMLAQAVADLQSGKEPDLLQIYHQDCDIKLHAPALLPEEYCHDVHTRLSFYKKLASAKRNADLQALQEELADRFGKIPEAAHNLFHLHRLRLWGAACGLARVDVQPQAIVLSFHPHTSVDPSNIISLIQKNRAVRLAGNDKLRIEHQLASILDRVNLIRDILRSLGMTLPN